VALPKEFQSHQFENLGASQYGGYFDWVVHGIHDFRPDHQTHHRIGRGEFLFANLVQAQVESALPASVPKGAFWGAVSGFTSFIAHAGGPPFQVFMLPQKLPKAEFAGTATILFAFINVAKIGPYQNLSPYSLEDLMSALVLVPFALLGTFLGAYLTQRIAEAWFFKLVQAGLFLISLKLIWDAIRG